MSDILTEVSRLTYWYKRAKAAEAECEQLRSRVQMFETKYGAVHD